MSRFNYLNNTHKSKICGALLIVIALLLYPCIPVYADDTKPVLSFTFDEDDKNVTAVTMSDGTLTEQAEWNGYTYETGKIGKCLYLDGTYGLKLNTGRLNAQSYTISFWVKPVDITAHTPILSIVKGSFEELNYSTVLLDENWLQPNITSIHTDENGSSSYSAGISGALTPDTWTHIAIVVDCTTSEEEFFDDMSLYIDGEYICNGLMLKNLCSNTSDFWIGINPTSDIFNGYIDELYIFNSALTAEDVSSLYHKNGISDDTPDDTDNGKDKDKDKEHNHNSNNSNNTRPGQSGNLFDDIVELDQGSLPDDSNSSLSSHLNPGLAAGMEYKTDAYADVALILAIILAFISVCCFLTYHKKKHNQY